MSLHFEGVNIVYKLHFWRYKTWQNGTCMNLLHFLAPPTFPHLRWKGSKDLIIWTQRNKLGHAGRCKFAGFWWDKDGQHWFLKDHGRRGAWYCLSCDSGKSSRTILRRMQTHAEFELNWFQAWASNNRKKSGEVGLEYQTVINCQTSGSSHPARLLYPPVLLNILQLPPGASGLLASKRILQPREKEQMLDFECFVPEFYAGTSSLCTGFGWFWPVDGLFFFLQSFFCYCMRWICEYTCIMHA